jgi:hypothetical protein
LLTDGTANTAGVGTGTSTPLQFFTNNTEVARFGSDGSFLVGTTTNGGWGTDSKIEAQTTTGCGVSGYATASGGAALRSRVNSTSGALLSCYYSTTAVGSVTTPGSGIIVTAATGNLSLYSTAGAVVAQASGSGGAQLLAGATAWTAVSLRSLKRDFAPITDVRSRVMGMRAELGRYINDPDSQPLRPFLYAEEGDVHFPSATDYENGKPTGLRMADFVPLLVRGQQDIYTENEALRARVAALEAKVN